jgi:triosephosphate isomerase (TIM)
VRPLVAGNWKMNKDFVEAVHLIQQLGVLLRARDVEGVDVMVIPPFTDLRSVTSVIEADRLTVSIGAQHVSAHERGAYTGETSVAMLARLGVGTVVVGHSERRRLFGMDDDVVAATLAAVRRGGLTPLLCVGEDEESRSRGDHERFVTAQIRHALAGAPSGPLIVAYEPIWAIGTGTPATTEDVALMAGVVRAALAESARETTRVLYGGSVGASNAGELARAGGVDGFLVGGGSLDAEEFAAIVVATHDCYASTA